MIWMILPLLAAVGFGAYWLLSRLPLAALAPAMAFALAPFAGNWADLASGDPTLHILVIVIVGPVTAACLYRLAVALVPGVPRRPARIAAGIAGVAGSIGFVSPLAN